MNKSTKALIIAILSFVSAFVVKAVKAGRTVELLISTPILVLFYYVEIELINYAEVSLNFIPAMILLAFPLGVYALYWLWLFTHEKITSKGSCACWADRNWWWALDGWEFEEEVARVFRLNGYKAKVTKKTGDGGIDLILYKGKHKYLVQCKHYKNPIPASYLRELNGIKNDFGADRLIMVASSGATKQGLEFLENKTSYFKLLDLEDIIRMGLRPTVDKEEVLELEDKSFIEAEVINKSKNEYPPFFPLD